MRRIVFILLSATLWSGVALVLLQPNIGHSQILNPDVAEEVKTGARNTAENVYDTSDSNSMARVVAIVIRAFLGLLGVIFIILIVLAGYNWMTAYGDESKVEKAKDTLRTSIIGLVIILAAYSITYFVFKALGSMAGGAGGGPGGSP